MLDQLPAGHHAPKLRHCRPHAPAQVQSLPGALPAQLVRPESGKVTWILDADSASAIGAEKWVEKSKDFPRSNPM